MGGPRYASVELHLTKWLPTVVPDCRVCTDTPPTLPARLLQVQQTAGSASYGVGHPTVNIIAMAKDRTAALNLGCEAQAAIEGLLRGVTLSVPTATGPASMTVSWMRTVTAPTWVPYENTTIRAALLVVELVTHTT